MKLSHADLEVRVIELIWNVPTKFAMLKGYVFSSLMEGEGPFLMIPSTSE